MKACAAALRAASTISAALAPARPDEIDARQRRRVAPVTEAGALEADFAGPDREGARARPVADRRRLVHDREVALQGGESLLDDGVEVAERAGRLRGQDERAQ